MNLRVSKVVIGKWWPPKVREWASEMFSLELAEPLRGEVKRLLSDPRMADVPKLLDPVKKSFRHLKRRKDAITFFQAENAKDYDEDFDDDYRDVLVDVLSEAASLRETWRRTREQPVNYLEIPLKELKAACDTAIQHLSKNRERVILVLTETRLRNRLEDEERFEKLVSSLRAVSDNAARGWLGGLLGVTQQQIASFQPLHPKRYITQLDRQDSEELFVTLRLTDTVNNLYGNPCHRAVALMVTVIFGPPTLVTPTDVKERWNNLQRRRGKKRK